MVRHWPDLFLFSDFAFSYLAFFYLHQPVTVQVHFSNTFWLLCSDCRNQPNFATALMGENHFNKRTMRLVSGWLKRRILAALIAVVFLQERLTTLGWVGVLIGAIAVFIE